MRLIELTRFIKSILNIDTYPLQFPNTDREDFIVLDIDSISNDGDVQEVLFRITNRNSNPSLGDNVSNEILDRLNNLTNEIFEGYQIIYIKAINLNPQLIGIDANNRYMYQLELRALVSEL